MNKTTLNKTGAAVVRSLLLGSSAICAFSLAAHANPSGGTVQAGSATITSNGTVTTIDQKTGKVVITWDSFSIGAGATVQFNQPGSSAIALNRVTGDQPSSIYGNLLANGQVWIINGNGILFGKGAQVNVGGLIATTADIKNQDFLNGDYSFNGATGASVVNQGTIRTRRGGYAVLSGASASNQGLIAAETGTVVIGGAEAYTVDFQGDGLLKYAITAPADNAKASNSGTIQATGGRVIMTARAANAVQDAVVNNTGMVSATSAKIGQNGEVIFDAGDGDVAVSGTVDVSGTAPGTTGGTVQVTGKDINVADGTTIDASGPAGGGTVEIGGNLHGQGPLPHAQNVTVGKANIFVDATDSGDGGMVVVWSDNDTSFGGSVSAKGGASGGDGGMVETSGHNLSVGAGATVNTLAPKGKTGDWLLDPTNIYIVDGDQGTLDGNGNAPVGSGPTNDLLAPSTIVAALNTTDVSLQASNQIEVVSNINYSSSHTLSMLSEGNIIVLGNVQNAGTGAINMIAGWDGTTTDPVHFTDPGVYGNNSGTITLENDLPSAAISGHLATVGSAGGTVTLAAATIDLTSTDAPVQVGFTGAGGGDIVMRATGDITLDASSGVSVTVGNGVPDGSGSGATSGNIDIEAGGALGFGSGDVPNVWVGNIAGAGSAETGNVTLVASTLNSNFDFSAFMRSDLAGGDVTLGASGDGDVPVGGMVYDSSHDLTLLASGNIEVTGTLENDGSGAVTLVAGWDGHTLDPAALKVVGAFGNNGGVVTIGGEDASGNVFVGSASGATTVLTGELDIQAFNGNAQLGYNGNGTGDITVRATGDVDLSGGDPFEGGPFAMIGNGTVQGGVINNPVGGNIDINIGGALVLETPDGSNPGGGTDGGPSGGGGGCDCTWQLPPGSGGGGKPLRNDNPVTVFIGNATNGGTGTVSGSVTMIAQDLDDGSDSNGGFSAIVAADIVNGDVTLGQHGGSKSVVELDQDFSYSSSHNLTVLSEADIGIDAVIQNSGSGSITLVAGWDGLTRASDLATTPNSFGNNGGTVYIGGEACEDCSYNAEIGSASGALNIYAGRLVVDGSDGYAQAGYHGAGGGDIFVTTTGDVTVTAGNDQAQIGNGSADNDVSGDIGGNITINAGGDAEFNNSEGPQAWLGNVANGDFKETGNVTLIASTAGSDNFGGILANDLGTGSATGGDVFIGLTAGEGTFTLGGVDYNSPHTLTVASAGNISIFDSVQNDGAGTINLVAGWDGHTMSIADIETNGAYGANNGTVYIAGQEFQENNVSVGTASGSTLVLTDNLVIQPTGDLFGQLGYHGDGGGDIRVVAMGSITLEAGGSGSEYAQIGNGSIEPGQVDGPATGNIDVRAKGVLHLISDDDVGSDWIGNASDGGESGTVKIVTGNLDEGDNLNVMLGADADGGDTLFAITDANASSTIGGAIDYNSSHTLSILTGGSLTIAADVQNQGTGALNIVAGWDGQTFDPAQFNAAGVYGNGTGLIAIGTGAAAGSVSVGSGGDVLIAGGAVHVVAFNGDAQIGYAGAGTGNIEVDAAREVNIETIVGSGGGLVAQIGNGTDGATGTFGGAITVNAASLSMIAGDNDDVVRIGNGGANTIGSFAGDIGIDVSGEVEIKAEGQDDFVQLGNGGGGGTGLAGGAITLGAGSLTLLSDAGATGSVVQVGNGGVGFTGLAEGDIAVTVAGALSVGSSTGGSAFIGNLGGSDSGPDHSGNATILAGSASGLVSTIDDVLAGGDLTIGITGGDFDWNQALTVDSGHTFNLMATGSITFDSSLKNSSTGALNIVAGWDGTTTDPALFGGDGVYGNGGGSVTIGGGSAGGNVAVGSARGEVDVYTGNLSLEADNGYAVLGYDASFAGTPGIIGVNAIDTVTLTGSDDQNVFAQIGTSQRLGDNSRAGNVGIVAGNISQSGTASVAGDEVRLTATSGDIGSDDANIAVASNSLYITTAGGDAYVTSPNMGMTLGRVDTDGGDALLTAGGPIAQTGAIIVAHLEVETAGADNAITLDNTGNSFSSLSVDSGAGADIYDAQGFSVSAATVAGGATLTLSSAGGITQSGVITADNLSVTATGGNIVLDDGDNAIGGLSVTVTNDYNATIYSGESIDLKSASVDGTLTLNTTGAITQDAAITVGSLNATAGDGGITLDNDGNDVSGVEIFSTSGDATFHNAGGITLEGSSVTGTLTLVAGEGGIGQDGAVTAGTLVATTSGSGDIVLDETDNAIGAVNLTTGSGDATVYSTDDIDIKGGSVGGTLTLNTTGAVTQDAAFSAGAINITAGEGGITLDQALNDVTGDVQLYSGGDATFNNAIGITVGGANVAGTLTLTAGEGEGIGQDGTIVAGGLSLAAGGPITLNDADNSFGTLSVSSQSASAVSITDSTGVELDDIQIGGAFTLHAGGDVTQTTGLGVTGALSVGTGDGSITLDNAKNSVSGTVSLDASGDADFHNVLATDLGASTVGGTLTLVSGGAITQSGALGAGTLDVTTTGEGHDITLTDAGNSFDTLAVDASGDADIRGAGDISVSSAEVAEGGTFTLQSGGAITQTGAIGAGTLSLTAASGITLGNDGNSFATLNVSSEGTGAVSITDSTGVALDSILVGGGFTLGAGGAVTQTANALDVAGGLSVTTSAGDITLDNDANSVTGTVSLDGPGDVAFNNVNATTLGASSAGGTMTITAGGAITQTGAVDADTLDVLTTSGSITLDETDNSFGTLLVTTNGDNAVIADGTGLTVQSAGVGAGKLTLIAGGAIAQSGAIAAGTLDVSTTSGAITLDDADNAFANLQVSTQGADGATIVDTGHLDVAGATVGGTLWLTADSIGQSGAIDANALGLIAANGVTLTDADNKFSGLEVSTTNSDASISDAWGIDIYSADTGTGALTLNSGGHVTQEADSSIVAGGLSVTAGEGGITLDQANDVSGDVSFSTDGDATFRDTQQITLGGGGVGGTLTLNSDAGIGQDGAFAAGTLTATAGEGTITLTNGDNAIGTVNLSTTSSSDVSVTSSSGLTLGQITVGGRLVVVAGEVDQNQALVLTHGIKVTSSDGDIALGNTANAVSGVVQLSSADDATFANTLTTQVGNSNAGGTLALLSKGDVDVVGVVQNTSGNIVVVAGWDGTTTSAADYGNSGVYGNANGSLVIGGAGTTNFAALGSQSGATTVYAYNVNVLGSNAGAQLGYHGTGGGDISVTALNDLDVTAGSGNALVGNGSLGTDVTGNVTGDIDLHIAGDATFSNSTNKITWFGNRTSGGAETGDVTLIAGGIDGENGADIGGMVTTDIVGGDVTIGGTSVEDGSIDNDKNYTYSSSHTLDLLTAGGLTIEGSIQNTGSGAINVVAGWDGHTLSGFDAAGVAGNNGKGVVIGGAGASGGVAIGSDGGPTSVYGAFLTIGAVNGYAQLGFHGAGLGAISVDVSGDVALNGGGAAGQYAQIGNGGQGASGSNGGAILVSAGGDVVLTGGAGSEAYAQIGHGGAESNGNSAGYANTGSIVVDATNVTVDAGSGSGAYAQIGHGGLKAGQGLTGEGDNTGDIAVTATDAVTLLGSGPDGYAQIGNGGSQSNLNPSATASGTDSGTVTVLAPNGPNGSVTLTAGAGANAYAQIGNGGYAVNAGAAAVAGNFTVAGDITVTDLALVGSGINGYAAIGNGDVTQTSYGNVLGDITIDANGNITYTNGTGTHSTATIGNFTGHGTTSGTIDGATPPNNGGHVGGDPSTIGTIVTTQASNNRPNGNNPITVINTVVITTQGESSGGATSLTVHIEPSTPGPLASLDSKSADSEPPTTADSATVVIADSLDGSKQGSSTQSLLGGVLTQNNAPSGSHAVHAIPPADQDFSSWGNEALWQ